MKKKFLYLTIVTFLFTGLNVAHAQIITTIAGGGTSGIGDGGPAISCELSQPYNITLDASGNLYVADQGNNRIRKINTAGIITTIAGDGSLGGFSGDGAAATAAKLNAPSGVAVDAAGNVYISDNYNHRIRKVNAAGIITTVAGTGGYGYNGDGIAATAATLYSPHGIAVDLSGSLYICDVLNNRIRKMSTEGIITTIAGNGFDMGYSGDGGQATATDIGQPFGVTTDVTGNIFFADLSNNRICKISTAGIISTIVGTGSGGYNGDNIAGKTAELKQPFGVAVDEKGNCYIADVYNSRIRKVNSVGIISTIAGTGTDRFSGDGGLAVDAEVYTPVGVTIDHSGNVIICDAGNNRIRSIKNTVLVNTLTTPIESVEIYPNPCNNGSFTLNVVSSHNDEVRVVITDVVGQKIKDFLSFANKHLDIHLDVPPGIYLLTVVSIDGSINLSKKIFIRKSIN